MLQKLLLIMVACMTICLQQDTKREVPAIAVQVEEYLRERKPVVLRGTEEFYALGSLEQALKAFNEGNYGIGSVVLLKWRGKVYEFRDRNAMVTGYGLRDHAEARALDRAVVLLSGLKGRTIAETERARVMNRPEEDVSYAVDTDYLRGLADGLHVYGTLEPCPMCMLMMINVAVKTSISLAKDGELETLPDRVFSNGAAMATDEKFKYAPKVWQQIRDVQGLRFTLYEGDRLLRELGLKIFSETRERIDQMLAQQK
jgi:tRNA(Arg) A34 adenosine deaminase TadA